MISTRVKNATTTAYAASLVASSSPALCIGFSGFNASASPQFIQVHNAPSLPADTAIPEITFRVAASTEFSYHFGNSGREFSDGMVICNSSTGPTKTIGSADCWFDVQIKPLIR